MVLLFQTCVYPSQLVQGFVRRALQLSSFLKHTSCSCSVCIFVQLDSCSAPLPPSHSGWCHATGPLSAGGWRPPVPLQEFGIGASSCGVTEHYTCWSCSLKIVLGFFFVFFISCKSSVQHNVSTSHMSYRCISTVSEWPQLFLLYFTLFSLDQHCAIMIKQITIFITDIYWILSEQHRVLVTLFL